MSIIAAVKALAAEVTAAKGQLDSTKVDEHVRKLCKLADDPTYFATPNEIDVARAQYGTGDVQVNDDALASRDGADGRWIMAWVWVRDA